MPLVKPFGFGATTARPIVELRYVQTDLQVANIFTKLLVSDNLQHFTEMLGIQHLDVPRLRETTGKGKKTGDGTGQRAKDGRTNTRGDERKKEVERNKEVESTREVDTSKQVGASGNGGRVKKDRANRKKKAKTRTWSDVVKGLKPEDELGTTNSEKRGNESGAIDLDKS